MKISNVSANASINHVIAAGDFLFRGQSGVIDSWYKAGMPFECRLYQNRNHVFGRGHPDRTSNRGIGAFIHWLEAKGIVTAKPGK